MRLEDGNGLDVIAEESQQRHDYAYLTSPELLASPVARVFHAGQWERRRIDAPPQGEEAFTAWMAAEGLTEIAAAPLMFLSGQVHAMTFATRAGLTSPSAPRQNWML